MLLAGFTTAAFLGALWGFSDTCAASNAMGCFLFGVVALFIAVPCAVVLVVWGLLVALGRSRRNSPRR